jgi:hypothetical protein
MSELQVILNENPGRGIYATTAEAGMTIAQFFTKENLVSKMAAVNGRLVPPEYVLGFNDLNHGEIDIFVQPNTVYPTKSTQAKQPLDTEVNKLVAQVKELFEENQNLKDQLKIESSYNKILRQENQRYRKWRPGLATGLFNTTVRVISKLTGRPCK